MLKTLDVAPPLLISQIAPPFQSVAIVGNSPRLIEAENGAVIDSHDIVIRINDGPTAGFEAHVGQRTTLRVVGIPIKPRHRSFFRELREASTIVTRSENRRVLNRLKWAGGTVFIDGYQELMSSALARIAAMVDIGRLPQGDPRTGLVILSLLGDVFAARGTVSLFGFETEMRRSGREHFFDDGRDFSESLTTHDQYHCPMEYEFHVLARMREASMISIY